MSVRVELKRAGGVLVVILPLCVPPAQAGFPGTPRRTDGWAAGGDVAVGLAHDGVGAQARGGFAPVVVAEKVRGNAFRIGGGTPGLEVSWQVTGIRQDAWANAHRIPVEEDTPADEHGFYLHPELFGEPPERGVEWGRAPEAMLRSREERARTEALRVSWSPGDEPAAAGRRKSDEDAGSRDPRGNGHEHDESCDRVAGSDRRRGVRRRE